MKVAANFSLSEFVSPAIYKKWGVASLWFLDKRLFPLAQFIRDRHGSTTINGTLNGHTYTQSGFREPGSKTGAKLSQHRFGRALDLKFSDATIQEVYDDIVNNFDLYKKFGLTTVENINFTKTWLHIDLRNTNQEELKIVNP